MQSDPNGIGNPPPPTRTTGRAKPGLIQLEGDQGGQGGNISFGMIVVNVHPLARETYNHSFFLFIFVLTALDVQEDL